MNVYPRPTDVILDPKPLPPEEIAATWIARRYRRPPATARAIAELAMLAGTAPRGR